MHYVATLPEKVDLIRRRFGGLIGQPILGYDAAQMWVEEEEKWYPWNDLPLVLCIGPDRCLSVSWFKFEQLAIEEGRVLPFCPGGPVRWVHDGISALDEAIGHHITSVALVNGKMVVLKAQEIWVDLRLRLSSGRELSIHNALDKNGYALFDVHVNPEEKTSKEVMPPCVVECV